jgi:C4-dicarboxylate-specific signal transduction histidine kinase
LHPDDRERVATEVNEALQQKRTYDTDYRVRLRDGRWRDIHARGELFTDADGKPVRLAGTCLDITERKQAEAALEKLNQELVDASHLAGMAEIATGVLHNVGNVLNSVGVSATLVANQVRHTKAANIAKLAALFDQHKADLAGFLATDPRGQTIPAYLGSLTESLAAEQTTLLAELAHLRKNIEHIKDIVAMQQAYALTSGGTETISIPDLIEEALRIDADALARYNVATIRDYQARPVIATDKHKVLQILINLVRNAKLACVDSGRTDKQITVRTTSDDRSIKIAISDNGVGVPVENLARIFNHGFTTREHGHGFALHSGALAAKELGGSLSVQSDGPGQGAVFTLEIPIAAPQPPA